MEALYKAYSSLFSFFLTKLFSRANFIEVLSLKTLIWNLYALAVITKNNSCLEDAARLLSKTFSIAMNDRSPINRSNRLSTKKFTVLFIVTYLFRIYFKVLIAI